MALVTCLALAVQKRRSWGQFFGAREFLGNFSPRVSGEMIQFEGCIFLKWVGEKPPTRLSENLIFVGGKLGGLFLIDVQ